MDLYFISASFKGPTVLPASERKHSKARKKRGPGMLGTTGPLDRKAIGWVSYTIIYFTLRAAARPLALANCRAAARGKLAGTD